MKNKKGQSLIFRRQYCWAVKFELFYAKQTCNPDYKSGEQPSIRESEVIYLTEREDLFLLKDQVEIFIKQCTSGDHLGSQRVRVLEIRYVGENRVYI